MDAAVSGLDEWRQEREMEVLAARVALERAEAGDDVEIEDVAEANKAVREAETALANIESEIAAAVAEASHTIEGMSSSSAPHARASRIADATVPMPGLSHAQVRMLREAGSMKFEAHQGSSNTAADGASAAGAGGEVKPASLSATQSEEALAKVLADMKIRSGAEEGSDDLPEDEDALFAEVDALIEGYESGEEGGGVNACAGATSAAASAGRANTNDLDVWTAQLDSCISLMKDDQASVGMALARKGQAPRHSGRDAEATAM